MINSYDTPESIAREREYEAEARAKKEQRAQHHPDCACDTCFYGADTVRRIYHASEY